MHHCQGCGYPPTTVLLAPAGGVTVPTIHQYFLGTANQNNFPNIFSGVSKSSPASSTSVSSVSSVASVTQVTKPASTSTPSSSAESSISSQASGTSTSTPTNSGTTNPPTIQSSSTESSATAKTGTSTTPSSATSTTADPVPHKKSTSTGAIVGGAVGGVAVIGLISGLIGFFLIRRRKRNNNVPHDLISHEPMSVISSPGPGQSPAPSTAYGSGVPGGYYKDGHQSMNTADSPHMSQYGGGHSPNPSRPSSLQNPGQNGNYPYYQPNMQPVHEPPNELDSTPAGAGLPPQSQYQPYRPPQESNPSILVEAPGHTPLHHQA